MNVVHVTNAGNIYMISITYLLFICDHMEHACCLYNIISKYYFCMCYMLKIILEYSKFKHTMGNVFLHMHIVKK